MRTLIGRDNADKTWPVWRAMPAVLAVLCLLTGPVPAQTIENNDTKIATGMAPLDVLIAEDAILENWAQFSMLIDGDGVADRQAIWARDSFTPDFKWKWYDADNKLVMEANSRDEMLQPRIAQLASNRHIPIAVRYDEITPTTAKTRTVVLVVDVPKSKVPGTADGVSGLAPGVPQMGLGVYHDTWAKVGGKWLKSSSTLYSANKGFFPSASKIEPRRVSSPQASDPRIWARETIVAHGMSPVDVLTIKNEIRQRWADYTLLLDGDGVERHSPEWAPMMFTPDLRWIWFDPEGRVARNLSSMEQMHQRFTKGGNPQTQGSSKHLPLSMKFDDITPTMVKTRSVVMFTNIPKSKVSGQFDGVAGLGRGGVPQVGLAVYHDTWRKEKGKWMKSESYLYGANKGYWGSDYEP